MSDQLTVDEFRPNFGRAIDWLLILACIAAFAASPTPDVNEAHYLTKARQFWQPNWRPDDLFLASGFAHWMFYATFGWLASAFEFDQAAWIGRALGWSMLAWGWESLVHSAGFARRAKLVATLCVLGFTAAGNLSGEWFAGGIEAKVPAYALVFFALSRAMQGRWSWVWPVLGLATGFHPLVGGWSFVAASIARCASLRQHRFVYPESSAIAVGLLFAVALGVFPAIRLEWHVDSSERAVAAMTYVRERINHHLYFWDFGRAHLLAFGLLVIGWCWFDRSANAAPSRRVVNWFAIGSLAIAACGIVLGSLSDMTWSQYWANNLLRLYWFRLADVAVPVAAALTIVAGSDLGRDGQLPEGRGSNRSSDRTKFVRSGVLRSTAVLLALVICTLTVGDRWREGRPGADRQSLPTYLGQPRRTRETQQNWVQVCRWIRENTSEAGRFITPRAQQTFKWYGQRTEYVNWKDIPQDARSICEWRRRMHSIYGVEWGELTLALLSPEQRQNLLAESGVDYVVMEQNAWRKSDLADDPSLVLIYPSDPADQTTYVVLRRRIPLVD